MKSKYKETMTSCFKVLQVAMYHLLFSFLFFGLLFLSPNAVGQNKKKLTSAEYGLWGHLSLDKISSDGNWISCNIDQIEQADTLYVKSTDGKKTHRFITSATGRFCGEQVFAFIDEAQQLRLLNLKTGKSRVTYGVDSFTFSTNEKYLLTHEKAATRSPLTIRSLDGGIKYQMQNVKSYSHNPFTDEVACFVSESGAKKVVLFSLKDLKIKKVVATRQFGRFTHFTWQPDGRNLAFMCEENDYEGGVQTNRIYYYDQTEKETYVFSDAQLEGVASPARISDAIMSRLTVSRDGSKVFFGIEDVHKEILFPKDSLQIWYGKSATVFPEQRFRSDKAGVPTMVAWRPVKTTFFRINDSNKSIVFFNGNYEFALSYDPDSIGTQYKVYPDADYYITNLSTGVTKLWLEAMSTEMNDISISPDGTYLAYYRNHHYWVYNFKEETHTNLTEKLSIKWYEDDVLGVSDNYGIAGWSDGTDVLYLYDAFDLWAIPTTGFTPKRLTNGYLDSYQYRLVSTDNKSVSTNFHRENGSLVQDQNQLVFHCGNGIVYGYKVKDLKGVWQTLGNGEMSFSAIRKAANKGVYAFTTQRFDASPDIRVIHPNSKKSTIIAQSNVFQKNYFWGNTEVIEYKNKSGVGLKGVLYFPAEYDKTKKYPMVVDIYDKQLVYLYNYRSPSLENITGFDITDYTLNGYFVLRPDIIYDRNDPGSSAADCTIAATQAVLKRGIIDEKGIGLIGHSFGGYETNFIITQTDLFSAAVSGAGISDLTSFYLSIGWSVGTPEIFRFENQQWRMDYPLFEDFESYSRNNPIHHVEEISTPLLLWAGEQDNQVNYNQSISMYLALRRLAKPTVLLVYPDESHAIIQPHFQIDLTLKIRDWFDYYLKKGNASVWLAKGL